MSKKRRISNFSAFSVLLGFSLFISTTHGYTQETRKSHRDQMIELASTLGSIHYLRGECERREDQKWRNYMLRLIESEQPSSTFKSELITTFNESYNRQSQRFNKCNRKTKNEAKRLAARGQQLVAQMMRNLN